MQNIEHNFNYKIDLIYDVSDFILFSSNNFTDKKLNTKTFKNLEIFVQNTFNYYLLLILKTLKYTKFKLKGIPAPNLTYSR